LFEVLINCGKRDTIFRNTPALKGLIKPQLEILFLDFLKTSTFYMKFDTQPN